MNFSMKPLKTVADYENGHMERTIRSKDRGRLLFIYQLINLY